MHFILVVMSVLIRVNTMYFFTGSVSVVLL